MRSQRASRPSMRSAAKRTPWEVPGTSGIRPSLAPFGLACEGGERVERVGGAARSARQRRERRPQVGVGRGQRIEGPEPCLIDEVAQQARVVRREEVVASAGAPARECLRRGPRQAEPHALAERGRRGGRIEPAEPRSEVLEDPAALAPRCPAKVADDSLNAAAPGRNRVACQSSCRTVSATATGGSAAAVERSGSANQPRVENASAGRTSVSRSRAARSPATRSAAAREKKPRYGSRPTSG